ncbi:MAG: hypothetical protein A2Y50_07985 [Pseudomonadales bacterium RIFCSPLOWO2_12_59_9]|nr:MAG: hypothetical protein A2Y50_07985 [Pseudomonadales bacterium RIFCSPLOWO2_12_59_9]
MSQGEYAHQGYIDAMYKFLKESLPQYQFSEKTVPWARAMHTAQMGGPYCLISAFYTPERAKFLRFTEPYGYFLPLGLVVRAEDKAKFAEFITASDRINIEKLLADEKLIIGLAGDRSYGPLIDGLLAPLLASDAPNVHKAYQDESSKILVNMLGHKRFDYMFGYPSEMVFYEAPTIKLLFYQIDGSDKLLEGRLSCTKGPVTDAVFADVSKLVTRQESFSVFQGAYERWLPEYLLGPYRQQLAQLRKAKF